MALEPTPFTHYKVRRPSTARQRELSARRAAQENARKEHAAGFRAARNGEEIPKGASLAFRTGHKDAQP